MLLTLTSTAYGLVAGWVVRFVGEGEAHTPGRLPLPATGGVLTLFVSAGLLIGFSIALRALAPTRRSGHLVALLPGCVIVAMLLTADVWGIYLAAPAALLSLLPMYWIIARKDGPHTAHTVRGPDSPT